MTIYFINMNEINGLSRKKNCDVLEQKLHQWSLTLYKRTCFRGLLNIHFWNGEDAGHQYFLLFQQCFLEHSIKNTFHVSSHI